MSLEWMHPGLLLIAAGLLVPFGVFRRLLMLGAPLVALALIWSVPDGTYLAFNYAGIELTPLRYDAIGRLFALVFAIAAFGGALFAHRRKGRIELSAALIYAGSAMGAVLAGDLVTLFVFWEIMALASTAIVWCGGPAGRAAGLRYAAIHLLGGALLMAGIAGEVASTGSTAFGALALDSPARWLILLGFLVNAGAWPISAWIPDAYPESSWSGMVFLSAFTTKTAVYALMRGFPGAELLVPLGLIMIVYGIVYAMLENDMRRMLAYSLVSQVGFMVVGIGIGTDLALNGVAALAFAHVVYKALLLMAAGAVLYQTGHRNFTEMDGLALSMPWTTAAAIIGALTISAAPLTSGFVSKSMIVDAASSGGHFWVWLLLAAATAGTALYAGCAFVWFGFLASSERDFLAPEPEEAPVSMRLAMLLMASICVVLGVWPEPLYALLPFPVTYAPYTASHVVSQVQLLLAAAAVFVTMFGLLARSRRAIPDVDLLWRGPGARAVVSVYRAIASVALAMRTQSLHALRAPFHSLSRSKEAPGAIARESTTGAMALWIVGALFGMLIAAALSL